MEEFVKRFNESQSKISGHIEITKDDVVDVKKAKITFNESSLGVNKSVNVYKLADGSQWVDSGNNIYPLDKFNEENATEKYGKSIGKKIKELKASIKGTPKEHTHKISVENGVPKLVKKSKAELKADKEKSKKMTGKRGKKMTNKAKAKMKKTKKMNESQWSRRTTNVVAVNVALQPYLPDLAIDLASEFVSWEDNDSGISIEDINTAGNKVLVELAYAVSNRNDIKYIEDDVEEALIEAEEEIGIDFEIISIDIDKKDLKNVKKYFNESVATDDLELSVEEFADIVEGVIETDDDNLIDIIELFEVELLYKGYASDSIKAKDIKTRLPYITFMLDDATGDIIYVFGSNSPLEEKISF